MARRMPGGAGTHPRVHPRVHPRESHPEVQIPGGAGTIPGCRISHPRVPKVAPRGAVQVLEAWTMWAAGGATTHERLRPLTFG